MKRRADVNQKDWELCRRYVDEMKRRGLSAHEPWEQELEAWAAHPDRYPQNQHHRKATHSPLQALTCNVARHHGASASRI